MTSARRVRRQDGRWVIWGDPDFLAESDCFWTHEDCPVVAEVNGVLKTCPCECSLCKRAWFAEGRPIVRNGQVIREGTS